MSQDRQDSILSQLQGRDGRKLRHFFDDSDPTVLEGEGRPKI